MSHTAVKTLYRYASKAAHPDAGGSTEAMVAVNAAYEALTTTTGSRDAFRTPSRPASADIRMPFGKHRGAPMSALPTEYLLWMAGSMREATWRRRAEAVLRWRSTR